MNKSILDIYNSMANFYNSNNETTNIAYEFPCLSEDITLNGLKEGELLVSYNPDYIQNSNGLLIGIDSRFIKFYHLNSEKKVVKTLELNWINNCESDLLELHVIQEIRNDYSMLLFFLLIFLLLIIKIIRRKNENY